MNNMHTKYKWILPSAGKYKCKTDASRLELKRSITINYLCKDNIGRIIKKVSYLIRDCPILMAEISIITEAIRTVFYSDVLDHYAKQFLDGLSVHSWRKSGSERIRNFIEIPIFMSTILEI